MTRERFLDLRVGGLWSVLLVLLSTNSAMAFSDLSSDQLNRSACHALFVGALASSDCTRSQWSNGTRRDVQLRMRIAMSRDQLKELRQLREQAEDALEANEESARYKVQSTPSTVTVPETDLQSQHDRAIDSLKEQERRAFERDFRDFVDETR